MQAVFADEAGTQITALVVPLELSIGPDVDAIFVSTTVVWLVNVPVGVYHRSPRDASHSLAILLQIRVHLPLECFPAHVSLLNACASAMSRYPHVPAVVRCPIATSKRIV